MINLRSKTSKIVFIFVGVFLLTVVLASSFILSLKTTTISKNSKAATTSILSVDANSYVRDFPRAMKGMAVGNWEVSWGRPFLSDVPGLTAAAKEIDPGLIRYAGGLWANSVGFDRNKLQQTPCLSNCSPWISPAGLKYYFNYGTDEISSLDKFAKSLNADVMIQVNISNDDPNMWADMVRYAKEKGYNFKYWEMGNEMDLVRSQGDTTQGIDEIEYGKRVVEYTKAMKAVDPNIQIIGGVPASGTDVFLGGWDTNNLNRYFNVYNSMKTAGQSLGALSYHWYQGTGNTISNVQEWVWPDLASNPSHGKNTFSRIWSQYGPQRIKNEILKTDTATKIGISELGVDPSDITIDGGQIAAVWMTDVMGRLAYNGLDFSTGWASYGVQNWSILYPPGNDDRSKISVRPLYYAYLMYAKYFGNQMVQSNTTDPTNISIWASRDTKDNKLKLMVTNISGNSISTPVSIAGFSAVSGKAYEMTSPNPTDLSANSVTQNAGTNINGVKIEGMNVAGGVSQIQGKNVTISNNLINYTFPAYSTTAIILDPSGSQPVPTATNTPVPTNTSAPSVTPINTFTPTSTPITTTKVTNSLTVTPIFTKTTVPTTYVLQNTVTPTPTDIFTTQTITPTTTPYYPNNTNTPTATPVPIVVNNTQVPPDITTTVNNPSTNISGQSNPNSSVNISVNQNNYTVNTDNSGSWNKNIILSSGTNNIKIEDSTGTKNYVINVSHNLPNTGIFEDLLMTISIGFALIVVGYLFLRYKKRILR